MERKTSGCQLKLTKFWIILSMQTIILLLLQMINAQDCEPPTKIECGRQGFKYYTPQKCVEDKRCCWNEKNIPNCYYKATAQLPGPQCMIEPINRRDCGDPSTKPTQCLNRSCCWNATAVGKWCYWPLETTIATTTTTTTTTPPPTTTVTDAPPPIFGNSDPCICSIRGDPIIVKFDGTRRAIQGSQTVNLFYNAERKTRVTAKLGPGKGMLSKLTVIESVAVSVGGDEDKLIFSEGAIQTAGVAPKYNTIRASNPVIIKLTNEIILTYDYKLFVTTFDIQTLNKPSYINDEGVCGVCPAGRVE